MRTEVEAEGRAGPRLGSRLRGSSSFTRMGSAERWGCRPAKKRWWWRRWGCCRASSVVKQKLAEVILKKQQAALERTVHPNSPSVPYR